MISSIAVPSSPAAGLARQDRHRPEIAAAWLTARFATPSDSTPIFTPAPLTPYVDRASAALCFESPCEVTLPRVDDGAVLVEGRPHGRDELGAILRFTRLETIARVR